MPALHDAADPGPELPGLAPEPPEPPNTP
ncbi:hypothetical protein EDC36_112101 [Tepidimonas ignava]|uniref:Uncharacterized protein n=1 Tax=Tepidimonas ignava TaxID=114249 RepID=A0A4R3L9J7_9BURK|nr:hypothetical protein EDC36_112101 [Tepidimonas ignava]